MGEDKLREIAILVIYNYYDGFYSKEKIAVDFNLAVDLMVDNSRLRVGGASSVSENGTSISYSGDLSKFSLSSDVLALLPKKRNFRTW